MKLSKNLIQSHFTKLVDVNISKVVLDKDGSYFAITSDNGLMVKAPAVEGYKTTKKAPIYGVDTLVKIIKSIDSPSGYINMDIDKHSIVLKTEDITFTFRLTDESAMPGIVDTEKIKDTLEKYEFPYTYDIFQTVIKNTLNSLSILENETIIFKSAEHGFDMIFGNTQLHTSVIHINGDKLPFESLIFNGKKIQQVLKSLLSEETIKFSLDKDGSTLKIETDDGYTYFISASQVV